MQKTQKPAETALRGQSEGGSKVLKPLAGKIFCNNFFAFIK